jgi:hypothetical protein
MAGAPLALSSNDRINFRNSPTAFAAPSPAATSVTSSPRCAPSDMSATALFAFALRPRAEIVISAADALAKFAISAAGRAWMPWSCPMVTRAETSCATGVSRRACVSALAGCSSSSGSPTLTACPDRAFAMEKRSPLVTTIGVIRLFARRANTSRSKFSSGWPLRTRSPAATSTLKPSPPRATVSMPTCKRISAPFAARSATACPAAAMEMTSPSQGAYRTPSVGSMATPSPSSRCANTASGVSSTGAHQPRSGETSVRFAMHAPAQDSGVPREIVPRTLCTPRESYDFVRWSQGLPAPVAG